MMTVTVSYIEMCFCDNMYDTFTMFIKTTKLACLDYWWQLKIQNKVQKIPANFLEKNKAVMYQYAQLIIFIFTYTGQESAFNCACPKWQ